MRGHLRSTTARSLALDLRWRDGTCNTCGSDRSVVMANRIESKHGLARDGREPCRIQLCFGEGLDKKLDGGGCVSWLLGNAGAAYQTTKTKCGC